MGKRKYRAPKELDLPRDVVLARRAQRKANRQETRPLRVDKPKVCGSSLSTRAHKAKMWDVKFRLCKKHREFRDNKCIFNVSHNAADDTFHIRVREATHEYLDWFWDQLRHGTLQPEWMLRVFPNVKEQTEAVAAYFAVKDTLVLAKTNAIVVADGCTPRLGGLLSAFVKNVVSIDPEMRSEYVNRSVLHMPANLTCVRAKIQDWVEGGGVAQLPESDSLAIFAIHAHVGFEAYLHTLLHNYFKAQASLKDVSLAIVAMPCCHPLPLPVWITNEFGLVCEQHDDWAVHSPHRTVFRWIRSSVK